MRTCPHTLFSWSSILFMAFLFSACSRMPVATTDVKVASTDDHQPVFSSASVSSPTASPSGYNNDEIPDPAIVVNAEHSSSSITEISETVAKQNTTTPTLHILRPAEIAAAMPKDPPLNLWALFGCILAFIPLLSLFGFAFGVIAYRQMKANPDKYRGKTLMDLSLIFGFIISVITIAVVIGMITFAD